MYNWKRWKGIAKGKQQCPKCHRWVDDSEYDDENDICYFCEFPETSPSKPAEMDYDYGYPRNKTHITKFMEEYENLPDKESSWRAEAKNMGIKVNNEKPKRKYKRKKKPNTYKIKKKSTKKKITKQTKKTTR